jgi:hypothetical protein
MEMELALGALLPIVLEEAEALWDISTEGLLLLVELLSWVVSMLGKTRGARLINVAPVIKPEGGGEVAETGMEEWCSAKIELMGKEKERKKEKKSETQKS